MKFISIKWNFLFHLIKVNINVWNFNNTRSIILFLTFWFSVNVELHFADIEASSESQLIW